jgi:gamma-glutamyltranspeptidase/glutathione hydrolase
MDMKTILLMATALMLCFTVARAGDRITGKMFGTRSEVIATHGMVATSQPLAAMVGVDILKKGGSAVDAAIAVDAMLGLTEPTGSGVGGDLFAIVWDNETRHLYGLNASGRCPKLLTLDYFKENGIKEVPYTGMLPVTVPGCVDGWFELHDRFGKLPMKEVLAPAIKHAREGFPVTELIAYYWGLGAERLKDQPNFAETFMPGGKTPAKGEIFRNLDLARTLQRIAEGGRDAFYKGDIAREIDAFSQRVGGFIRYDDLAEHTSTWVEPLSTNYRGYDVWELPPNGQGIAVLQMLNILEGFDLGKMDHNSAEYLHLLIETTKIVYEDRAKFYADPAFNNIPIAWLISKDYARQRRGLIQPGRALRSIAPGVPPASAVPPATEAPSTPAPPDTGDTVYLTVVDDEMNAVSLIQSNYAGFGSGMVPDGLGFSLQDRGALFSLEEGHMNVIEPGKRPFHTIIPAFVTKDGEPFFCFGVMGGDMQPQGHIQILCNMIDFGMNTQEAGDAARFHHVGSSGPEGGVMTDGGQVALESGIPEEVRRELSKMGHNVISLVGGFGGYQGILIDVENHTYYGASESRKDGCAVGY